MKRFAALLLPVLFIVFTAWGQRTDLSGLKFCIDPGHGGNNPATDRYVVPDPGTEFWESESARCVGDSDTVYQYLSFG
jgi:hypothetical protein